jgi:hypothetical protein
MLSSLLLIVRFHARIGYLYTLNLFAAFATRLSVKFDSIKPAGNPHLMSSGKRPTYLAHFSIVAILRTLPIYAAMSSGVAWFWTMLCCRTLAAFYWLIECPSHRFARHFARHSGFSRALPGLADSAIYRPIPAGVVISTGGESPS